jgi:TonB family protein
VNKKKLFFISACKNGREGHYEIIPKRRLLVGNRPDCDIIESIAGFPERHHLLEKTGGRYYLRIPSGIKGNIASEGKSLSLQDVIEFDLLKKRGDCYLFPLPKKGECRLTIGDHTLIFGYRDRAIPERKHEKIDNSLKKPFIGRENYSFLLILFFSIVMHFSAVGYLNSLELKNEKPIDAIKSMPQRFAKLILQPPQKKVLKSPIDKQSIEKKEEKGEDKKEDEPKKEEIKPSEEIKEDKTAEKIKEEAQDIENHEKEVAMLNPPEKPASSVDREAVREKVKSKGLLGVIMAKALPDEISSDIVLRDVDKIVKGIDKGGANKEGEDLLDIRGLGRVDDLSKNINETMQKIKQRDTSEIISEKRELIKEELNKNKAGLPADNRKRNEAEVYRTVGTYIGGLKYLYNNSLRKNPLLKGKITVKIVISQDGKVVKSEIVSSTLGSPELEEAIINRIYRWRFSALGDVEDFTIDYTFDFAPLG